MKNELLVKKLKYRFKKKVKFTFAILVIFMITGNIGLAVDTLVFNGGVHTVAEDIEVDEDDSVAIEVSNGGVVTSKGNITTTGTVTSGTGGEVIYGEVADGMYAEDSEIINDGKITTLNRDALGMDGSNSKLTNNGIIEIKGNNSTGMAAGNNSTLTNNGEITTSGSVADGIYAENSEVRNDGKIETTGHDLFARSSSAFTMGGHTNFIVNHARMKNTTSWAIRVAFKFTVLGPQVGSKKDELEPIRAGTGWRRRTSWRYLHRAGTRRRSDRPGGTSWSAGRSSVRADGQKLRGTCYP